MRQHLNEFESHNFVAGGFRAEISPLPYDDGLSKESIGGQTKGNNPTLPGPGFGIGMLSPQLTSSISIKSPCTTVSFCFWIGSTPHPPLTDMVFPIWLLLALNACVLLLGACGSISPQIPKNRKNPPSAKTPPLSGRFPKTFLWSLPVPRYVPSFCLDARRKQELPVRGHIKQSIRVRSAEFQGTAASAGRSRPFRRHLVENKPAILPFSAFAGQNVAARPVPPHEPDTQPPG